MNGFPITDSNTIEWRKSTFAEGVEVKDVGKQSQRDAMSRHMPGASTKSPLRIQSFSPAKA